MNKTLAMVFCLMLVWPAASRADYSEEIKAQIKEIEARSQVLKLEYFHDMAIVAHKADDAELNDLARDIIRSLLLKRMDDYIEHELVEINKLYESDRYLASKRLQALNHYERFYEPSQEFLSTTSGQAIDGEMVQFRKATLDALKISCSEDSVLLALAALRRTGLFTTHHPEEITSMQEIIRGLECCLAFKKKINYRHEEPFESEYEVGTLTEEGHLVLQTSGQDYSDARWVGEWIYKFKGKEGTGEGVSQATMTYHKGEKSAELVVSASHVSSAGRMNFPMALAGSKKDVTIEGEPMDPQASFFSKSDSIPLTGCHEN